MNEDTLWMILGAWIVVAIALFAAKTFYENKLTWYRIVKEGSGEGGFCYRVQRRGWRSWTDCEVIEHLNIHGPSLASILRFDTIEAAEKWIDNHAGRNEVVKVVVGTYGVYG